MNTSRLPLRTSAATVAAVLGAGLLASAPAVADSVVTGDPTATNVTSFGTTAAWSRRGGDGRYRLVVMGASRVPADAHVRSSSVPFDPDAGPIAHGRFYVVYTRCRLPASSRGCDIYGYDVASRTERKITSVSTRESSEFAPSYYKGSIAFGRRGSHGGLYVASPGHRPRRISRRIPHETDLSATHVVSNSGEVVLARRDGSHQRELGDTQGGEEAFSEAYSPVLSRDRAFWVDGGGEYGMHDGGEPWTVRVLAVPVRGGGAIAGADRSFLAENAKTIALGPSGMPELYSGDAGVRRVNPLLAFAS
jgi:hypothetical protein